MSKAVVLGIGNVLLSDEGIGVHAVKALVQRYDLGEDVEVVDGGTTGMELLPDLEGATISSSLTRSGLASHLQQLFVWREIRFQPSSRPRSRRIKSGFRMSWPHSLSKATPLPTSFSLACSR